MFKVLVAIACSIVFLWCNSATAHENVDVSASDGTSENYGILSSNSSYSEIYYSKLKGTSAGIQIISGTTRVMNSTIEDSEVDPIVKTTFLSNKI
jgi:hypothetical protein